MDNRSYLSDIIRTYRNYKVLADNAIAQVTDAAALHQQIDPDSNSIAVVVRHVAGNLRSRFRDFLTTDGEKPERDRDNEFEMPEALSRADLLKEWDAAWTIVFASVEALTPDDLDRTIYIRREGLLVVEALNRSVTHTAYHVGQIVYLARHLTWPNWQSLSIPKGQSANVGTGTFKTTGLARSTPQTPR